MAKEVTAKMILLNPYYMATPISELPVMEMAEKLEENSKDLLQKKRVIFIISMTLS